MKSLGVQKFTNSLVAPIYDAETTSLIQELKNFIDPNQATALWQRAINSKWEKDPVWVHGDVSSGNIRGTGHIRGRIFALNLAYLERIGIPKSSQGARTKNLFCPT